MRGRSCRRVSPVSCRIIRNLCAIERKSALGLQTEPGNGGVGQFTGGCGDIQDERIRRLFEVSELAGENGFTGKMTVTSENMLAHLGVGAAEIDDAAIESGGESVAIALFESGAGQDGALAFRGETLQFVVHAGEP